MQNVESFARNLFKEQNRDFDAEFAEFKKNNINLNLLIILSYS